MPFLRVIYEIILLCVMATYAIITFANQNEHPFLTDSLIDHANMILTLFFAIEYVIRFSRAEKKLQFVVRNWFDLIALIPLDHYFLLVRFMRIIRLIRIAKASPFLRTVLSLREMRWIFAINSIIIIWCSVAIYFLEKGINPSIKTFADALWWSVITITTVGYGDISPVTAAGRIVAVFLMFTGISFVSAFTAELASHWRLFFHPNSEKENTNTPLLQEEMKNNIVNDIYKIENLTDEEYKTLMRKIDLLRRIGNEKE